MGMATGNQLRMQHSTLLAHIDPLDDVMESIRRHPNFDDAALRYIENVIAWRKSLGRFNRVGTNIGFHIVNYAMYLHFAGRIGANEHGATFSAMLEICEQRKQCGGRALRTVLAVLGALGYLRSEYSPHDRRIRTYVPSDRLIQQAADIYGYAMGVIDELLPGSRYKETIETDPAFLWQIIAKSGRVIVEDGVQITEHFPELNAIISQAGGLPTTISLANAQLRGTPFPSQRELAKSFTVSTSQVRSIVNALPERGLITLAADGSIADAQPLIDQHKGLIARELALHVKYALGLEERFLHPAL